MTKKQAVEICNPEFVDNRVYTDAVDGFTIFGAIVQSRTTLNFTFCSIRLVDGTIRMIRL